MKSATTSFATVSLFFGLKSSAFMLPETSIVSTMSMPSVSTDSDPLPACGRASATMASVRSAARRTGLRKRFHDEPPPAALIAKSSAG